MLDNGAVFWGAVTERLKGAVRFSPVTGIPDTGAVFWDDVTGTGAVFIGSMARIGAVRLAAVTVIFNFHCSTGRPDISPDHTNAPAHIQFVPYYFLLIQ